ncbi:MAG: cytochrome c biogenesis protein [Desulfobacterales bacterium]|nr:cytochrome c biogenesis protein [Desulfobacterales bacterium]
MMDWSNMDAVFFKAALVAYLAATVGYLVSLVVRRVVLAKAATWILGLAVALHTVHFLFVFNERGVNVAVNLFEAMSFFAWIVAGAYLAFQIRTKTRVLGAIVAPFAVLLMMLASLSLEGTLAIPDALQGRLVPIHVTLSIIGEGLFALASLAGIMYCIQDRQIRQRRMGALARYLPSLRGSRTTSITWACCGGSRSSPWGSSWVALGQDGLGRSNWATDPKTIWSFAAWCFYAFILHQRLAIGWEGKKIAVLSIVALMVLISAFIGVNFVSSVHRFTQGRTVSRCSPRPSRRRKGNIPPGTPTLCPSRESGSLDGHGFHGAREPEGKLIYQA